jgi:hypothetical protein
MEIWATRAAEIMQPSPVVMGTLLGTSWNNWNYIKLYFFPYTQFTPASYKRRTECLFSSLDGHSSPVRQFFFLHKKYNTPTTLSLTTRRSKQLETPKLNEQLFLVYLFFILWSCQQSCVSNQEREMTTMILLTYKSNLYLLGHQIPKHDEFRELDLQPTMSP